MPCLTCLKIIAGSHNHTLWNSMRVFFHGLTWGWNSCPVSLNFCFSFRLTVNSIVRLHKYSWALLCVRSSLENSADSRLLLGILNMFLILWLSCVFVFSHTHIHRQCCVFLFTEILPFGCFLMIEILWKNNIYSSLKSKRDRCPQESMENLSEKNRINKILSKAQKIIQQ